MNITLEQSKKIETLLETYIKSPEPDFVNFDPPLNLNEIAREVKLLPLLLDMGGCIGIQASGEFFSFIWDEPFNLLPEHDDRVCNTALFVGSKRFPELSEFVPARPLTARDCDYCNGSGTVRDLPPKLAEAVRCYCGGLGWIP